LALIDYLTNEILIVGRITFFNHTDSWWHWRLSGDGSVEIVSTNGTKKIMKKTNKKLGYFVVKAIWPRAVPLCRNIFYKSPLGAPESILGSRFGLLRHRQEQKKSQWN